ncbi:MAG: hypothetical protein QG585_343 [Patescibacteria group bacterium]|jgi:hypothetical protein|nr:hypothetical protein [Patescibacteria group bacterium]
MINRDKTECVIGILILLVPLSGFPTSIKTIATIILGGVVLWFALGSLEKKRRIEREKEEKDLATRSFIESHPEEKKESQVFEASI